MVNCFYDQGPLYCASVFIIA